jgi:hypothetical protein
MREFFVPNPLLAALAAVPSALLLGGFGELAFELA